MLELILLPSLLGLGLAIELLSSEKDDTPEDDPPVEHTLSETTASFDGTDAKDHVQGNALDNYLFGAVGNDLLGGHDGDDTLEGGIGDDRLFGSAGNDAGWGGAGDDRIFLGDGDDTTAAPSGLAQDAGDDFIRGGDGADTLIDTQGNNHIHGDLGPDTIITIDGLQDDGTLDPKDAGTPDTVHAGYGNDTLIGDDGDILTGGEGKDSFVVATALQTPGAPVVVTDFDLRDDLFSLVFMEQAPVDPTVRFTFDPQSGLIHAAVDNQDVATLSGLTAADIPFIQTYVTTLPELMET
ncbi:calcium-binding protein [Sulfitobacter sp. F26204]|uniref:calcium-binding protein n=1 Tax=Sulfitobacter sp. F26204 TaxID=2996014 RepID=UPI00225E67C7|nr:calcium-binding protein [Sulfitobacter sp. F26204]MCX7558533.1 calcium-binding protein [Sulfitobacter sp. F26204]